MLQPLPLLVADRERPVSKRSPFGFPLFFFLSVCPSSDYLVPLSLSTLGTRGRAVEGDEDTKEEGREKGGGEGEGGGGGRGGGRRGR